MACENRDRLNDDRENGLNAAHQTDNFQGSDSGRVPSSGKNPGGWEASQWLLVLAAGASIRSQDYRRLSHEGTTAVHGLTGVSNPETSGWPAGYRFQMDSGRCGSLLSGDASDSPARCDRGRLRRHSAKGIVIAAESPRGMWVRPMALLATLTVCLVGRTRRSDQRVVHGIAVGVGTAILDLVLGILLGGGGPIQPILFLSNGGRILAGSVLGGWLATRQSIGLRESEK